MEHINFHELFEYPSRDTETEQRIEQHLSSCTECQSLYERIHETLLLLLRSAEKMTKQEILEKQPDCPDEQVIDDYVESVLLNISDFPIQNQEWIEKHLEKCDYCLNRVLSLTQMWFEIQEDNPTEVEPAVVEITENFLKKLHQDKKAVSLTAANIADAPSWSAKTLDEIKDWLKRFYEKSVKQAETVISQQPQTGIAYASTKQAKGNLPVNILDEYGNTLEVAIFSLETDIQVDSDGELVFSALAPEDKFIGKDVKIFIADDEQELYLCSAAVDSNRRMEVFADLSLFVKEGIQINKDMINAKLV